MRNTLLNLPLHPTMRHPLTGQPLRAVGHRADGRAIWPIMGGAPDDGDKGGSTGDDGGSGGDDGAKGGAGGSDDGGDKGAGAKGDKGGTGDLGFPANTPVAEMTTEQQVAYYKHQSRKHEDRASAYWNATGGKTADEVKKDLDEYGNLQRQSMSEHERAIEDAKKTTREETAREYGPRAVRAALDISLEHLSEQDRNDTIDTLDLTKFLTDSGDVDTAKVRAFAARTAPADKDKGKRDADYGGGRRGGSKPSSGLSAGAERYAQRRGKTAASSST